MELWTAKVSFWTRKVKLWTAKAEYEALEVELWTAKVALRDLEEQLRAVEVERGTLAMKLWTAKVDFWTQEGKHSHRRKSGCCGSMQQPRRRLMRQTRVARPDRWGAR